MAGYMTKDFNGAFGLNRVSYVRCGNCGFVQAQTLLDLPIPAWERLNEDFHRSYRLGGYLNDDPRWNERIQKQAEVIARVAAENLLPQTRPWLDFACGDGALADQLARGGLPTRKYDPYMQRNNDQALQVKDLTKAGFDVIINTSFIEHLRDLRELDTMLDLLASTGVLCLHTLVRENIPMDPSWFYFLPVHVSFFTNQAIRILFNRWNFSVSIYHVEARLWFFFKQANPVLESAARALSLRTGEHYLYTTGFLDYWKD